MPRYFFHLAADERIVDDEGMEFASETDAEAFARKQARAVAAFDAAEGSLDLKHAILVQDEIGQQIVSISLSQVVDIKL